MGKLDKFNLDKPALENAIKYLEMQKEITQELKYSTDQRILLSSINYLITQAENLIEE